MKNLGCANGDDFGSPDGFYECGSCGNHICGKQAEVCRGVCPHCFGRLYKIS